MNSHDNSVAIRNRDLMASECTKILTEPAILWFVVTTLALLDETFGNTARDPRDTLLLAAGADAGVWTESLSRSFDFGRGYAEGRGMSLL